MRAEEEIQPAPQGETAAVPEPDEPAARADAPAEQAGADDAAPIIRARGFSLFYGGRVGVKDIDLDVHDRSVTSIIGPSGCGKSTFLRGINRMNDLIPAARASGLLEVNGQDIYDSRVNLAHLRQQVAMIFDRPNPFPKSIYNNVAYGPRIRGIHGASELEEIVERCLIRVRLWSEVKDDLRTSALALSKGQQQRLCIARALATAPKVLLMDEPCNELDPVAAARIEELITSLKKRCTIVVVTRNMQQAARVSDHTAFFCLGELVEAGLTRDIYTTPKNRQTEDYVTGRFG